MLYWILRGVARIALRWYYRDIHVVGAARVPAKGAAILAANHNNALVDALVVGSAVRRKVRLTAKATLLDHPLTRGLVAAVGIVPLRRTSDERKGAAGRDDPRSAPMTPDDARNADAFATIVDSLAAGGLVLIFPEGKSHSEPALAPLKTGCARIALQARDGRGLRGLPIIPVGLTFERKGQPRSRVLVHVGVPIDVDAVPGNDPTAVQELTARVDAGLRDVTLNFATPDDAARLLSISSLLADVLDEVRPLHAPDAPLSDSISIARRLEEVRRRLPHASADTLAAVDDFLTNLDAFRERLRRLRIPVYDITLPTSAASGLWFVIREGLIVTALLPLALWGRLNHWLPIALARRVALATSRNADEPAMHTLVSGLAFVIAFYVVVAAIVAVSVGWRWAAIYLLSLPPAASLDFWLSDRLERARRRAGAYFTLRRDPLLRDELREEAQALRSQAERLDAAFREPPIGSDVG